MKKYVFCLTFFLWLNGCQSYRYAHQIKLVAFHDDFSKAESVGNIRGEDCQSFILGIPIGPKPTLDRAFEIAQKQVKGKKGLKYMNDVSTEIEGFNAFFFKKDCLVVKGKGYK